MSVITATTKDVSLEVQEYAPGGTRVLSPGRGRAPTSSLKTVQIAATVLPPLALAIFLFIGWYVSTTTRLVNPLFLPAPGDVWTSLTSGLSSGVFLDNTLVTIQESLLGFLLALVIALPLGYGLAKSRWVSVTIQPYLAAGQAIPAFVVAPFLILWFSYNVFPNIVLCMLVVLFPMVITTALGVQTIDQVIVDAARVEGAAGWSLLAHIEFPLALPAILAAVRTGLTLSITGAVVGEFVSGGDQGLGGLILQGKSNFDTAFMFATLVILALLAMLYYGISWLLMRLAKAVY